MAQETSKFAVRLVELEVESDDPAVISEALDLVRRLAAPKGPPAHPDREEGSDA